MGCTAGGLARSAPPQLRSGRSSPIHLPDYHSNAWGPGAWELPYGPSTVGTYALAAHRHMHEYGTTREQLAQIAVQCRANAAENPDARYRGPLTVEDVIEAPQISSPLGRYDCCVVTDSGGAFVLASRKRAEQLSVQPVYLLGFGEAIGQIQMNQMPDFTQTAAARSGADALRTAGMTSDTVKAGCAKCGACSSLSTFEKGNGEKAMATTSPCAVG